MLYRFTYPGLGITQIKIGIPHAIWEECKALYHMHTKDADKEAEELLKKHTYGMEWFTEMSPLFDATLTGFVECNGAKLEVITEFLGIK